MALKEYEVQIDPDEASTGAYILIVKELQKHHENDLPFKETLEKRKYPSAKDLVKHIGRQRIWRASQALFGCFEGSLGIAGNLTYLLVGNSPEDPVLRSILTGFAGTVLGASGYYMLWRAADESAKLRSIEIKIRDTYTVTQSFSTSSQNSPPIEAPHQS